MMDLASEPLTGAMIRDGVSNVEGGNRNPNRKPKIVVIMGPTGSGKSRLAIDLAHHFPVEIVNADSMQVYRGLDVLTNKVPLHEQNGVPHHLLGTISPNVEFTAKAFRDSAIPIIDDILSHDHLPVIVGGTNYYIQALVSPFLLDDKSRNLDNGCLGETHDEVLPDCDVDFEKETECPGDSFDCLKAIDPVAANRIHPNNLRKIKQYLSLYAQTGVLPSKLFQGKNNEKRRICQLQKLFGWSIHHVDATEAISGSSENSWDEHIVQPTVNLIRSFYNENGVIVPDVRAQDHSRLNALERDLWTQYICKACDQVLRGGHEWEQHRLGRRHRKRVSRLKKIHGHTLSEQQQIPRHG